MTWNKWMVMAGLGLAVGLPAQVTSVPPGAGGVRYTGTNPNGTACTTATAPVLNYAGTIYTCQAGFYAAVTGAPGPAGPPMDINALTEQTTPTLADDTVAIYDVGLAALRKVKLINLPFDVPITFTSASGVTRTTNTVACNVASGSLAGCLSSADWTAFNSKYGSGSNALLGSVTVTATGAGTPMVAKTHGSTVAGNPFFGMQNSGGTWIAGLLGSGLLNVVPMAGTAGVAYWDTAGTVQKVAGTATDCVFVDGTSGSCGIAVAAGDEEGLVQVRGVTTGTLKIVSGVKVTTAGQVQGQSFLASGLGTGKMLLTSGTAPDGATGTGTVFADTGHKLSYRSENGTPMNVSMIEGCLAAGGGVNCWTLTGNASVGANAITESCANHATTGTKKYFVAKRATNICETATIADVAADLCIVTNGSSTVATTTGSAECATSGVAYLRFSGASAAGLWVVLSTDGKVIGTATPTAGVAVLGRALEASSGADQDKLVSVQRLVWPADPAEAGLPNGPGFVYADGAGVGSIVTDVMQSTTNVLPTQLPEPTTADLGAIREVTCPAGQFVNKVDGTSTCADPAAGAPATFFNAGVNTGGTGTSIPSNNGCRTWSTHIPTAVTFSHMGFRLFAADTPAAGNTFSIGIYGYDADQSAYTNPATREAYITFGTASIDSVSGTDTREFAIAGGGTATVNAGWHMFTWCGSSSTATATIGEESAANGLGRFPKTSVTSSATAGVTNASVTFPASTGTEVTVRPLIWLVKK